MATLTLAGTGRKKHPFLPQSYEMRFEKGKSPLLHVVHSRGPTIESIYSLEEWEAFMLADRLKGMVACGLAKAYPEWRGWKVYY